MIEGMDTKTLLIIAHLFGVALGAGGAFASDGIFLKSIKDQRISKTEMGFIVFGSAMVWVGLKFLAKMTVVFILIVNGIVFHISHIPRFFRHVDQFFHSSDEFMRKRWLILSSGAVSIVSWSYALILGALPSVHYSYTTIMLVYILLVLGSVGIALSLKKRVLPDHRGH
jgi:hypothetical protein